MAATRRDALAYGAPHLCGPGCPGKGEARTDQQASESYEQHGPELEAQLARMLAARKVYAARFRPRWWWLVSPDAEPYRANPAAFEDPRDFTTSSVELEPWIVESIHCRQVEETGRLRFLARHGLLEPWEEQLLLSRGGVAAQAVAEELPRRVPW
jgi:hypothetical protein